MALRRLQDVLLKYLDDSYIAGELIINSQSAHIYGHSFQHTDDVLKEHYQLKVDYSDPVGNFVITVEDFDVLVTQTTPGGQAVREYKGTIPLRLVRQIAAANPGIQAAHLGYLGIEIERACQAYDKSENYRQDSV
jgi:thymidylate synthase